MDMQVPGRRPRFLELVGFRRELSNFLLQPFLLSLLVSNEPSK